MARVSAHCDNDVPAIHGPCVFHEIFDQARADISGRLIAKSGQIIGKWQIIVDCFRDMDELDLAFGGLGDLSGRAAFKK